MCESDAITDEDIADVIKSAQYRRQNGHSFIEIESDFAWRCLSELLQRRTAGVLSVDMPDG